MQGFVLFFLTLSRCCSLFGFTRLPFYPTRTVAATPAAVGLGYEDVRIRTQDGKTLAGWFLPAPADQNALPAAGKTLLFLHGNAGNISHCLDSLDNFHKLGFAVLIIDYRGFGQSTGTPSVMGTLFDAIAAWDWLAEHKNSRPESIVVFGRSIGGGVAAALAGKVNPGALIMESTFTCLHDVVKSLYPYLPARVLLPQDFDSIASLRGKTFPLLVVHSPDDEIVPYALGEALFAAYRGPKQFLRISGPHITGFQTDKLRYVRGLEDFLRSLPGAAPAEDEAASRQPLGDEDALEIAASQPQELPEDASLPPAAAIRPESLMGRAMGKMRAMLETLRPQSGRKA